MKKSSEKRNTNTASILPSTALVPYQMDCKTKAEADAPVLDVEQYLNALRNNQYNQDFLKLVITDSRNSEEENEAEEGPIRNIHFFANKGYCVGNEINIHGSHLGMPLSFDKVYHCGLNDWPKSIDALLGRDKNLREVMGPSTTFQQGQDFYPMHLHPINDYVLVYKEGVPVGDITRTDGIPSYQPLPKLSLYQDEIVYVSPIRTPVKLMTSGAQGKWSNGPVQMLVGVAAFGFNFVKNQFGFGQASAKPLATVKVSPANTVNEKPPARENLKPEAQAKRTAPTTNEKPEAAEGTRPEAQTQRKAPPQSSFIRSLGVDDYLTVANYLVHFVNAPWTLWANKERPLKDAEQKQLIEHQATLDKLTHQFTYHRPVRAEESGAFADKFKFVRTELRTLPQDIQKMLTYKKTSTTAFGNLATRLQKVSDQIKLLGNNSPDLKLIDKKAKRLAKKAGLGHLGMMIQEDATTGRLNYKVLDAFETQTQKQIARQAHAESQTAVQSKNLVFSSTRFGTQSVIGSHVPGSLPKLKM